MAASMNEDLDLVDTDDYYAWLGLSKEVRELINSQWCGALDLCCW